MDDLRRVLCFVYRVIVASEALLEFALPLAEGELLDYYRHHLEEERGHEKMLENDLKALGVTDIPRSHRAAQIAGSQYYLLAHDHPALLLGYMHALESNVMKPEQVDELSKHHGVELTALKHHAIHDQWHKQDLERMIAGLNCDLKKLVAWNESNVKALLEETRV